MNRKVFLTSLLAVFAAPFVVKAKKKKKLPSSVTVSGQDLYLRFYKNTGAGYSEVWTEFSKK